MCVITTAMAGTATAAAIANTAIASTVLATGLSAYSSIQSGKAQSEQAKFQAKVADANAQAATEEAKVAEQQKRRQVAATLGSQKAAFAANGVDISDDDTSVGNILGDTAQWGDYDARLARYNGDMRAWAYKNQATGYNASAKQYTTAGAIGAGTSLLSGASKVSNQWYTYSN